MYEQLAHIQLTKGNRNKALDCYNKALSIERKEGRDVSCMATLNNIGYYIYFQHDNDCDRALYYYRKALAVKNRDPALSELNSIEMLNILGSIGSLYAQKGQFDSASIYFQQALDQISPGTRIRFITKSV